MIDNIMFYNPKNRDISLSISEIFGDEQESVAKKLKEMDNAHGFIPKKSCYKDLLSSFNICSVREQQGFDVLNEIGITNVRTDIDPTFLLKSTDWVKKLGVSKDDDKYIFAYYFELTPTLKDFIEKLSIETGCYVKYFGSPVLSQFKCKCKPVKDADPIDFVRAVYNAEYIVTNSFHGTAFSINFNKNFFVELLQKNSNVNSRLINILEKLNLENRTIDNFESIRSAIFSEIDWESVNRILNGLREQSYSYIGSELF